MLRSHSNNYGDRGKNDTMANIFFSELPERLMSSLEIIWSKLM